jgi:hypothetical protein
MGSMSDSYQAIYDAVRSRISNGNVGEIIRDVAFDAFDISNVKAILQQEFCVAAAEMCRPSTIHRPALSIDGNKWCALYGENLQDGVAGFGDSPDEAFRAFDAAWFEKLTPRKGAA